MLTFSLVTLLACVLSLFAPAFVVAQTDGGTLPSHARANRYGGGWECPRGYNAEGQTCVAIEIPTNAYFDASRNQWQCVRGYLRSGKQCVAVKLPENAYLDDSPFGTGWRC